MFDWWAVGAAALLLGIAVLISRRPLVKPEPDLAQLEAIKQLTAEVQALRSTAVPAPHAPEIKEAPELKELPEEIDPELRAREILIDAMQRSSMRYVNETTTTVVTLATEDLKGRIIGREGRNMRSFEQVTGVDLLMDETADTVVLSCFDARRREIARITLEQLLREGKIQPSRIEELHAKAETEVNRITENAVREAADQAGVPNLNNKIIQAMGSLKYRTSYAQNVLDHSVETARIAAILAAELGVNPETTKRAAFLHDIGKGIGPEWDGPHALAGMKFLKANGEREPVLNAVGAHHREIAANCPEAELVIVADSLSASRPGARSEALTSILERQSNLEAIANRFEGVEKSYAVQSGRELRVLVNPKQRDDSQTRQLAADIAKAIKEETQFPGQIKVTVIRELRATEVAE